MEGMFRFVRERPVLSAVFAVGLLVLLFFLFRRPGSEASSGVIVGAPQVPEGLLMAELQAGTQLRLAQLQLAELANQRAAEIALAEAQIASQERIAEIESQTLLAQQAAAIAGQLDIEQQRLATEQAVAAAEIELAKRTLSSQEEIARAQIEQELALQKIAADVTLQSQAIAMQQAVTLSEIQTSAALAQTAIVGDVQKALAELQTQAFIQTQKIAADVQKAGIRAQTSSDIFGGLLNFAGSIFSDRRLKTDVRYVETLANGVPLYAYRYSGDETVHIGFMAQDVAKIAPHVVSERDGFLTVNQVAAMGVANAAA